LVVCLLLSGCESGAEDDAAAAPAAGEGAGLADKPLPAWRTELLELAFEAGSAFPLQPYVKNRARAQQQVVEACLELDQPQRALEYIKKIPNWRRGMCYAHLAYYLAENGRGDAAQPYLDLAARYGIDPLLEWRTDRVRVRIAQTHALLGHPEKARAFQEDVVPSEQGKVLAARAAAADGERFEALVQQVDGLVAGKDFDVATNALASAVAMYDRNFGTVERRELLEEKIKAVFPRLSGFARIDLLLDMARIALGHGNRDEAQALARDAGQVLQTCRWRLDDQIPLTARVGEWTFRAGDEEGGRAGIQAALDLFEANREDFRGVRRARLLRPIAEAYQGIGEAATALGLYERAVEQGYSNPAIRARIDVVVDICCSMALHGAEPGADLLARLRDMRTETLALGRQVREALE
jgi:hypothetical protein